MTDDIEPPTKNTLFLAVTRPALWAGIPIEAAVLLLISSASVLIWSNSPLYTALVVAFGYSISRLIVRHDVNAFRLLFLWGRTKLSNRNRNLSRWWALLGLRVLPDLQAPLVLRASRISLHHLLLRNL